MDAQSATDTTNDSSVFLNDDQNSFVTFRVSEQLFGVPVVQVQDILSPEKISPIPLAPREVKGAINLRGRIVTVIDVRTRLRLPPRLKNGHNMAVTVEHDQELYTLLVDSVGDVVDLPKSDFESNPATLDPAWREVARGVYRLNGSLMVVLDIDEILDICTN
jgi:purine-binding chemotaxis protein CheW